MTRRLGVGFIGSGFITRFHIRSWAGRPRRRRPRRLEPEPGARRGCRGAGAVVRVGDARGLRLHRGDGGGAGRSTASGFAVRTSPRRQHGPHRRRPRRGADAGRRGVEKPLAATPPRRGGWSSSSRRPASCTAISRTRCSRRQSSAAGRSPGRAARRSSGRPYLARAAEEHSGPHMPWFWQGDLQGGGVLNDMMCHSLEVGRHLLTEPGAPRTASGPEGLGADRVAQVVAARSTCSCCAR